VNSTLGLPLTLALALPLAWAGDQLFGEPRNALHPVAWIGRVLAPVGGSLIRRSPIVAFAGGAVAWIALAAGIGWIAATWQHFAAAWPWWLGLPAMALALKPTFAWRMLRDEVAAVDAAFDQGIVEARSRLARLVSRDVSTFEENLVRETAIETLAENLNDSVVAPLFWFVLLGLPGAAIYRFANTADAMWGYRGRYEWAGKWAAHADDVLSWWPARLTAWMLSPTVSARTLRVCRDEARRTPSPNGGWPMSAMALRLGVRLRKPGEYALNAAAPSPGREQVTLALRLAGRCAWQSAVAATATLLCGWRAW
jgi:adenosylcobinamide-phosphate synthase